MEVVNTRVCSRASPAPGNAGFDGCLELLSLTCRAHERALTVWDDASFAHIDRAGAYSSLPKQSMLHLSLPMLRFLMKNMRGFTVCGGGQEPPREVARAVIRSAGWGAKQVRCWRALVLLPSQEWTRVDWVVVVSLAPRRAVFCFLYTWAPFSIFGYFGAMFSRFRDDDLRGLSPPPPPSVSSARFIRTSRNSDPCLRSCQDGSCLSYCPATSRLGDLSPLGSARGGCGKEGRRAGTPRREKPLRSPAKRRGRTSTFEAQ